MLTIDCLNLNLYKTVVDVEFIKLFKPFLCIDVESGYPKDADKRE